MADHTDTVAPKIPTYTAEHAERLIKSKSITGDYHVSGNLYLRGCDLSGVTLPSSIGGWLDLSGCDLSGVTLPSSIGGWLYLRGIKPIAAPSNWYSQKGEATKRRVIASDGEYALIQLDSGGFVAGCRNFQSAAAALSHWKRTDKRAVIFTAAIKALTA